MALAAIVALRYPLLRVCMWTCPIVFLSSDSQTPLLRVGLNRGAEVLLGGLLGALLHVLSEWIIARITHEKQTVKAEAETNLED